MQTSTALPGWPSTSASAEAKAGWMFLCWTGVQASRRRKQSKSSRGSTVQTPRRAGRAELASRIRAVLRRSTGANNTQRLVRAGNVDIDLDRRVVTRDGASVAVTRTEWLLLQHLAANVGKVLMNAELLSKVWGPEYRDDVQYLRVWTSRRRAKLEAEPAEPAIIKTRPGIGYYLDGEAMSTEVAA